MKLSSLIAYFRTYPSSIVYREGLGGKKSIILLPGIAGRLQLHSLLNRDVIRWEFDNSVLYGRLIVVLKEKENEETQDG